MRKILTILAMLILGIGNVFAQEQSNTLYDEYLEMGYYAYEKGNYESAINWFTLASKYIERNSHKYQSSYTTLLNNLAICYDHLGKHNKAIELGEQALSVSKEIFGDKHLSYATSLNELALLYSHINNFSKAIELSEQALAIYVENFGEDLPDYTSSLNNLASYYGNIKNYTKAIELEEQALAIRKNILGETHPDYASSLNNLASYYGSIKNYTKAIELEEQALVIRKNILGETHPDYASSLNNLASYYGNIKNYTKAIELEEQALAIRKNILGETHPDYVSSLNNLASYYGNIKNYTKAIELEEQALAIRKNILGETHPDYISSLNSLALNYKYKDNHIKVIEQKNQPIATINEVVEETAHSHTTPLSDLTIQNDSLNTRTKENVSLELKSESQETTPSKPEFSDAVSLNNLAIHNDSLGNYATAIDLHKQVLEINKAIFSELHPNYVISLNNLVAHYYTANKINNISPLWRESLNIQKVITLSQFREMTSSQRQMYRNSRMLQSILGLNSLFPKELANNKTNIELYYNSLLFSKGVILSSNIEFNKVFSNSGNMELLEKFNGLRSIRSTFNTYNSKPITERPKEEIESLENQAKALEKDLLTGSKEYAEFSRRLEIEWKDVQSALGDKDVAIEFIVASEYFDKETPSYYAALVLRKGWDAPKFVDLCEAEELQTYFDKENGLAMMFRNENSHKLYNLIWGKLAKYINEGDNVYFSPAGLLHQINAESLQDINGQFANHKYNIHRVSSTRELCFEKLNYKHSKAVLYGGLTYYMDSLAMVTQSRAMRGTKEEFETSHAFGLDSLRSKINFLSASRVEIDDISKLMKRNRVKTTQYVEQYGNEESFKALSGKKIPIIHISTHGFFLGNEIANNQPLYRLSTLENEQQTKSPLYRSGLSFAGAQKIWFGEEIPNGVDDGILFAQEIASLDLNGTDLMVLSASDTSFDEINYESIYSLQQALKNAGVRTLIMSLWKVEDNATSLFMQTFYKFWLKGQSKHDAFVATQKFMQNSRQYSDPYYWAAFIMLD